LAFSYADGDAAVEALLWEGILRFGGDGLYGTIHARPSGSGSGYGDNSMTLAVETLSRRNRSAPGRKKPSPKATFAIPPRREFPLRLHREVEEYLDRYGLDPAELEEILSALEGRPGRLPFLARPLLEYKARFVSAGMDADAGLPVLLFSRTDTRRKYPDTPPPRSCGTRRR